jgi:FMN phosphatase YigB (HAD superfamily)
MPITHIFFDLHGTLVDSARMIPCYAHALGNIMQQRYGGDADAWMRANRRILDDWDSYYADLDLNGDDAIAALREGEYRTTRALFRLTNTPEPPQSEITDLARELPELCTQQCNALFPESKSVVEALAGAGYLLGTVSNVRETQARGTLNGGGIRAHFTLPLYGVDLMGIFGKSEDYFERLHDLMHLTPAECLIVDDLASVIVAAKAVGFKTAHIIRQNIEHVAPRSPADYILKGELTALPTLLHA